MAVTNITISTASFGLATAVTTVIVTLNSPQKFIYDTTTGQDVQRSITAQTNSSGLLTIGCDPNAHLSDTGSTYTFQIGVNVYSGIVVPVSGSPVALISLVPVITVTTVAITYVSIDPSGAPEQQEGVSAQLSVSAIDGAGNLVSSNAVVQGTTDTGGMGTIHLERTDLLTVPGHPGLEPYYRISIGGNTYYKYVRGAGVLTSLPEALPASVTGSAGATASSIAASGTIPPSLIVSPTNVEQFLDNLLFNDKFGNLSVRTVTTTFTATNSDDVILVDATSGNVAGTIPTAIGQYKPITIIKIDTSGHTVTLTPSTGGQTIDVGSALVLSAFGAAATLVSDQANWWSPAGAGAGSFLPAGAMPYYTTPWGRQTLGALHYFP